MKVTIDKEKTLESIEELISTCDSAAGRLIVTAVSGNDEVMKAMNMISSVSNILGQMAEQIEYPMEEGVDND